MKKWLEQYVNTLALETAGLSGLVIGSCTAMLVYLVSCLHQDAGKTIGRQECDEKMCDMDTTIQDLNMYIEDLKKD